ncbi:MAG: hydrogenase expression/formation protein HypE [Candidatus Omnitrophica bacterium]|nr:hydrogenase expression/formation protein HypE [Candidatus Omnitrophota bacterium]MDD5352492.1 hydrogenase expression/formation protein HypE [Candidatus Omnitrophota bacterium]MDD5550090.1 hydrogenase expression/formation protein HypE [Candidatus Omnitrophota bacterium]
MNQERITLSHGSGGKLMADLIGNVFLNCFGNKILNRLDDAAKLQIGRAQVAFTTDSYTVKPLFFPGGDIGKLAICGTLNDLAVMGAQPIAISASFIIEDGFLIDNLKRIVNSMARTAKECRVDIVTGDTKVVGKGECDGIFITTSGIGVVQKDMNVSANNAKTGDSVIISGELAEHGTSILNARENLGLKPDIKSDVTSVYPLIKSCLSLAKYIHVMRDPTRGGLVAVLNEIAKQSKVGIKIREENIPVKKEVKAACEILGLDYLNMANEGRVVFIVDSRMAGKILAKLQKNGSGKKARIIGRVIKEQEVALETKLGTSRLLPLLEGEALPRIC